MNEQAPQVLQAVHIDVFPLQSPVAVAHHVGNVDAGMNGGVLTQKQGKCAWLAGIDVEIVRWLHQHALQRNVEQIAAPFLIATLHDDFRLVGDALVVSSFLRGHVS